MGTPQVLTGVGQLETAAKGETSIELHPTLNCICVTFLCLSNLVVQTVLVLDLLRDQRVVAPLLRLVPQALPFI